VSHKEILWQNSALINLTRSYRCATNANLSPGIYIIVDDCRGRTLPLDYNNESVSGISLSVSIVFY
jgi:hypothetical protein